MEPIQNNNDDDARDRNAAQHDPFDDPNVTAYALGELDDPADLEHLEALVASDRRYQEAVAAIRETASVLTAELGAEEGPSLSADQRAAMAEQIQKRSAEGGGGASPLKYGGRPIDMNPALWRRRSFWACAGMTGIAACATFVALWPSLFPRDGVGSGALAIKAVPDAGEEPDLNVSSGSARMGTEVSGGRGVTPGQPMSAPSDSLSSAAAQDEKMKDALGQLKQRRVSEPVVEGAASGSFVEGAAPVQAPDRGRTAFNEGGGQGESAGEYFGVVQDYFAEVHDSASGDREGVDGGQVAFRSQMPPSVDEAMNEDVSGDVYSFNDVSEEIWMPWSVQQNTLPLTESLFGKEADSFAGQALREANARISLANEAYSKVVDNAFNVVTEQPLSTFSIDVDTASYSNIRRIINTNNLLPPAPTVRIEEMVNYFDYQYAPPAKDDPLPFSTNVEIADCPWEPSHKLAKIGLRGKEIPANDRPATNLVFLLDVSGSMGDRNKLPLVKKSMAEMVNNLTVDDRVAIVTYAGNSQVVLESTPCFQRQAILDAIDSLSAGGSTNGAAGITQAYDIAASNAIPGGVNRVVLATDGDFNVGISNKSDLLDLIDEKADTGVFLSVLGFGMGNYKDDKLETLADHGNGNYAYIDSYDEAYHVLVEKMAGTLVTIAKDVKIQIEFNPARVASYRLIGYENRVLAARDFNDDTIDAGEIGAGHTVTALYEIVPAGPAALGDVAATQATDDLVYQENVPTERAVASSELFNLKLRYKDPDGEESKLVVVPVADRDVTSIEDASPDFRFAAAVASYGMLLRKSPYAGNSTFDLVLELAVGGSGGGVGAGVGGEAEAVAEVGADADAEADADAVRRSEFVELVRRTVLLTDTGEVEVEAVNER